MNGRPSLHAPDSDLFGTLREILPADALLTAPEELRPYECDGLSVYRELPRAVVLPRTVEQVQAIMRLCSTLNIPVVARGAGTGLSGGALPLKDGILLSLARFNRILHLNLADATATVQPGVRNLAISQAVAPYGM